MKTQKRTASLDVLRKTISDLIEERDRLRTEAKELQAALSHEVMRNHERTPGCAICDLILKYLPKM